MDWHTGRRARGAPGRLPTRRGPAIPCEEAIEEALCDGWVDRTYRSLDDERGMLWYSLARSNKERVARLEARAA